MTPQEGGPLRDLPRKRLDTHGKVVHDAAGASNGLWTALGRLDEHLRIRAGGEHDGFVTLVPQRGYRGSVVSVVRRPERNHNPGVDDD